MEIMEGSLHGVPLLTLVGEADQAIGLQLVDATERAMIPSDRHIILDLERCPYLDSSALNTIVGLVRRVGPLGLVGVIHCPSMVLRLLQLVNLTANSSFRVFASIEEAAAAAGSL